MSKLQDGFNEILFLSYSWNDSDLASAIDNELRNSDFVVKRDKRDIDDWTSIKKFMSSIRDQDYAIIIISSSYLKSPNCMYEVMELFKDSQYENKIFSIVTEDADIYNPISKTYYIKYWEDESRNLEEKIKCLAYENTSELTMDLRKYKAIATTMASFLDLISDKNNPKISNTVEKIIKAICANRDSTPINRKEKCLDNDVIGKTKKNPQKTRPSGNQHTISFTQNGNNNTQIGHIEEYYASKKE